MEDAKLREKAAQAEMREFNVAEKRGTLVHVDRVRGAVEVLFAVVKSRLTTLPARLASKVPDPGTAALVEAALREEVNDALRELSADRAAEEAVSK
jgi:hypothetical protein